MAKEKRTPHKVVMTEGKREIIRGLLSEYDIQLAQDIQEALKDLLGGTIKEMMEAEMEAHLGYVKFCSRFENNIQCNFGRRRTKGLRQSFRKMVTKISTCNETLV